MAVESHDKKLDDLLKMVEEGKAQLPDFQRSWVWDDTKICKLIESITSGFPMGAAMFLANGGELGYHGYNHQPLSPSSVNYGEKYASYKTWKDKAAMKAGARWTTATHNLISGLEK